MKSKYKTYKLGDFCNIAIGRTPRREKAEYWGKGYTWVSISDMKGKTITESKEEITDTAILEAGCKPVKPGTLLMSFKLSIGKLAFAGKELFTNEAIAALSIKNSRKVFPEYLYYALKFVPLTGSNQAAKGKTLNKESLYNIQIPLPESLSDQIRIAALLSRAEALIEKRRESLRLLDELVKGVFLEMFGEHQNDNWRKVRFEDMVEIQSGQVDPRQLPYSEMWHIGGDNIESETGNLIKLQKAKELRLISGKYFFSSGDILYSKIRPYLNKVARPKFNGICSADIYPLRPKDLDITPEFLLFILKSAKFLAYANKHSDRANIPKINREALNAFEFSLPPLPLQTQFATIVERVESLKAKYAASLAELENLYGSLSQRAFRGELDLGEMQFFAPDPEGAVIPG